MILVFGGTTEGRKAVEVLEEAGTGYYYSTRTDGQQVELVHGIHLKGDLDVPKAVALCREHKGGRGLVPAISDLHKPHLPDFPVFPMIAFIYGHSCVNLPKSLYYFSIIL